MESGLLSEFFYDLIARIIPGFVAISIFIGPLIFNNSDRFKDGFAAVSVPAIFMLAWLIGCFVDIISFEVFTALWKNFCGPDCPKLDCDAIAKKIDTENPDADRRRDRSRKFEKHIAEQAMFRNLTFICLCASLYSLIRIPCCFLNYFYCIGYFLLAVIWLIPFFVLWGRAKKMEPDTNKNPDCPTPPMVK